MTAIIIDLAARRQEREETERRRRIEAFDRELRRRLALLQDEDEDEIPVEPIRDNPYY
ncbi:hypothetical protein [Azospirillum halopraeferens]|uniref:hypothetical protein n=1 Tax=Azospirillum halopraeferens TaxID=34010 RepID=UPI0003F62C47|nr:hypothetical protein [Azospirillum halopraeferens]